MKLHSLYLVSVIFFYARFNVRQRSQGWRRSKQRLERSSVSEGKTISWITNLLNVLPRTDTYNHTFPQTVYFCSRIDLPPERISLQFLLLPQSGRGAVYTFQGPRISAPNYESITLCWLQIRWNIYLYISFTWLIHLQPLNYPLMTSWRSRTQDMEDTCDYNE
jgi:hypothetical protein